MTDRSTLTADDLSALAVHDTPTICNALEIVAPERRGHGFTVSPFFVHDREAAPIVGFARTATIRASQPSGRSQQDDVAARVAYYRHIDDGEGPTITVVEDIDAHPGTGAWWGEVNSNVHKGLGSLGVITNGSIRDLDDWADGFQALAGMVNPSHAWVHVVDIGVPVTVHGMRVVPGDLIHADVHGAVVVPHDVVRDVPAAVERIVAGESRLIEAARRSDFSADVYATLVTPTGDH